MRTDPLRLAWLATALFVAGCQRESLEIRIDAAADEQNVVAIRDARGTLVRTLVPTAKLATWDTLDDAGQRVAPGVYAATVFSHRGFATRASGTVAGTSGVPFPPLLHPPGAPIGVVADATRVYLAWSGGLVAACGLDGTFAWTAVLPADAGCAGLAIDGTQLIALAANAQPGPLAESLVRLNAADGQIIPWSAGATLPIASLWPADARDQPTAASSLGAGAGRIYLSFSELHFLAVLDAQTGAYLQTIIGPAPTALDVVATQTQSPNEPGAIIDADFSVIALGAGALGKVLFAHDPLWVIGSDVQRLDAGELITALAVTGDRAAHLPRSIFTALGPPHLQVQRREILDPQGYVWLAGQAGGRPDRGPWQRETLGPVKGVALAANGRLWVAESDPVPPRFSEWNTEGTQGHLVREFFGPLDPADCGVALLPGRPEIVVGAGCEWRIAEDGAVECLGVITREGMKEAGFFTGDHGSVRLRVVQRDGAVAVFERRADGDYAPLADTAELPPLAPLAGLRVEPLPGSGWRVSVNDGPPLGVAPLPADIAATATLSPPAAAPDGRVFGAVVADGIRRFEITGLRAVRTLGPQKLRVSTPR